MANYTRYRSGVQRVDDVLGIIQKDIEDLETSAAAAATTTAVNTLISTLFNATTYTVATMNTAPTDGTVRFVTVSDGGLLGTGSIAVFIDGHWKDSGTGDNLT